MALPKKRRFRKFSSSKLKIVTTVHRRRHRGFRLGSNQANVFLSFEVQLILSLYSHTINLLYLVQSWYISVVILYMSHQSSIFTLSHKTRYASLLSTMLSFSSKRVYFMAAYSDLREKFCAPLFPASLKNSFSLSPRSGALLLRCVDTSHLICQPLSNMTFRLQDKTPAEAVSWLGADQQALMVYLEKKKTSQEHNAAPRQSNLLSRIWHNIVAVAKTLSSTLSSSWHKFVAMWGPLRFDFAFMSYLIVWCRGRITFDQLAQKFHTSTDIFDFFIHMLKQLLGQAPHQQKSTRFDRLWARLVLSYVVKPLAQIYIKLRKRHHHSIYGFIPSQAQQGSTASTLTAWTNLMQGSLFSQLIIRSMESYLRFLTWVMRWTRPETKVNFISVRASTVYWRVLYVCFQASLVRDGRYLVLGRRADVLDRGVKLTPSPSLGSGLVQKSVQKSRTSNRLFEKKVLTYKGHERCPKHRFGSRLIISLYRGSFKSIKGFQ
jgi:hypothetical protein